MTIDAIIKKIEKRPDFYPKSTDHESAQLLTIVSRMIGAQTAIEIGTCLGYGTLHILKGMDKPRKIWTVDWKPQTGTYFYLLPSVLSRCIQSIQGTSAELRKHVPRGAYVDLIFIDANHTYTWLLHDLRYTLPYIQTGTCILFHDALNPRAPGVHACTRLFHIVNLLSVNRALEVLHVPTPMTKEGETSGFAIARIKTKSKFLIWYIQEFFYVLHRINKIHLLFRT